MRKQGPCRHCGITSTPLWRNGPPEKPVLCNACGSRWRTKGTLKNYTPLHCRGPLEEEHSATLKRAPFNSIEEKLCTRNQDVKIIKNKRDNGSAGYVKDSHGGPHDNISNWSSSGSAISFAESCSHFSIADSSEVTGSLRSNIADSLTPSWKRKPEIQPRSSSPVEKLTEDLHSILHQHPSYFLESSEEDLLYDNMSSVDYTEIGHGGFLIRNMNSTTRESGSTSSSFPDLGSKTLHTDSIFTEDMWSDGTNTGMDNDIIKMVQEYPERGLCQEECQIMLSRDSVLGSINLKDVISYDIFMTHLTPQEQERLMKYLPSADIDKYPESVKTMFSSLQFEETLCNFQELICQGALDHSSYTGNVHDYQTLQQLVLLLPTNRSWVEHYTRIKAAKHKVDGPGVVEKFHKKSSTISSSCSISLKSTYSSMAIESPGPKLMERGPRKKSKIWMHDDCFPHSPSTNLSTHFSEKHLTEFEGSGFGPDSFFTSPLEKSCISDPPQPPQENSYENLLIDVSSNSSFPEAVLLSTLWEGKSL